MRLPLVSSIAAVLFAAAAPAHAVVGGAVARDPNGVRQSVVRVESSRGELCSGVLIAPDLVLTAAHCVLQRAAYRVIAVDSAFRQRGVMAVAAALHPAFVPGTTPRTQPGVDLALLKLSQPLGPDFVPLDPRTAAPVGPGEGVEPGRLRRGPPRARRATARVSAPDSARLARHVAGREPRPRGGGFAAARRHERGRRLPGRFRGGRSCVRGVQLLGIVSWSSGALRGAGQDRLRRLHGGDAGGRARLLDRSPRTNDLQRYTPAEAIARPRAPSNAADWVGR